MKKPKPKLTVALVLQHSARCQERSDACWAALITEALAHNDIRMASERAALEYWKARIDTLNALLADIK